MINFDFAIKYVLRHEGGFVNDPNDKGGTTNYGISARFLASINKPNDYDSVKNMPLSYAKELYFKYFWEPNTYGEITDIAIATKIFDMAVNMGAKQANILAQRSLLTQKISVRIDGIVGNQTIAAINSVNVKQNELMIALMVESACYYRGLKNDRFLKGWLTRAYSDPMDFG